MLIIKIILSFLNFLFFLFTKIEIFIYFFLLMFLYISKNNKKLMLNYPQNLSPKNQKIKISASTFLFIVLNYKYIIYFLKIKFIKFIYIYNND